MTASEQSTQWRRRHPAQAQALRQREYASARERRRTDPQYAEHRRAYKRQWRLRQRIRQAGSAPGTACDCCGTPFGRRAPAWDHDHQTGQFRGWLCHGCNTGLGSFGDSPERLGLAIKYLAAAGREPRQG